MKKFGHEMDSKQYWEDTALAYSSALENDYHRHRLDVILHLIPKELFTTGRHIFDFGCGDACIFPIFLKAGAKIEGVDISTEMILNARKRLVDTGYDDSVVRIGGVNDLQRIQSASLDALLSFNVLAYLTNEEEQLFYQESSRIIRPGGYLVVTHSNELFDMFTLNRYTLEFLKKYLVPDTSYHDLLNNLISSANIPDNPIAYNIRENPLTYKHKVSKYGFSEMKQEFINLHTAPPPLLSNKSYPNTLGMSENEKWKLMFVCSTYGSCCIKEN